MGVSREEIEEFLRLVGSPADPNKVKAVVEGKRVQGGAGARTLAALFYFLRGLEPPPGLEEEAEDLKRKLSMLQKGNWGPKSVRNAARIVEAIETGRRVPKDALSPASLVLAARALGLGLKELVSRINELRTASKSPRGGDTDISLVKAIRLVASGEVPADLNPERLRAAQEFLEVTKGVREALGLSLEGLNRRRIAILLLLAKREGVKLKEWMERRAKEVSVGSPNPDLVEAVKSRDYPRIPSSLGPWEIARLSLATGLRPTEIKELLREAAEQRRRASEEQKRKDLNFLAELGEKVGGGHPLYLIMHKLVKGEWPEKWSSRNIMEKLVSTPLFLETFEGQPPLDFDVALGKMLERLGLEFSPPRVPPYMKEMYRRAVLNGRSSREKT